jgi:hypothetical protein
MDDPDAQIQRSEVGDTPTRNVGDTSTWNVGVADAGRKIIARTVVRIADAWNIIVTGTVVRIAGARNITIADAGNITIAGAGRSIAFAGARDVTVAGTGRFYGGFVNHRQKYLEFLISDGNGGLKWMRVQLARYNHGHPYRSDLTWCQVRQPDQTHSLPNCRPAQAQHSILPPGLVSVVLEVPDFGQ